MKLTEATREQKLQAMAEIDGFKFIKGGKDDFGSNYSDLLNKVHVTILFEKAPKYFESYDAIIPLIHRQSSKIRKYVAEQLWIRHGINSDWTEAEAWVRQFLITPTQLADALLLATGKFEA